jgi:hypothetical protein
VAGALPFGALTGLSSRGVAVGAGGLVGPAPSSDPASPVLHAASASAARRAMISWRQPASLEDPTVVVII